LAPTMAREGGIRRAREATAVGGTRQPGLKPDAGRDAGGDSDGEHAAGTELGGGGARPGGGHRPGELCLKIRRVSPPPSYHPVDDVPTAETVMGWSQVVAATASPLAAVSAATMVMAASGLAASAPMPAMSAPRTKPKSRQNR
jgi:hypothetical protein